MSNPSHETRLDLSAMDLNSIVEAFEVAWNRSAAPNLSEFLPAQPHPDCAAIVAELFCVDLERRWSAGDRGAAEDYRVRWPEFFSSGDLLAQLAFEEFRIRRSVGEDVSSEAFRQRYAIDTSIWPDRVDDSPAAVETRRGKGSTLRHGLAEGGERTRPPAREFPGLGSQFAGFQLLEELGTGRFGRVYLARQPDLANRHVVLKLSRDLWGESERLAKLQHTNIVPVYSVHQQDELQAVCMPYRGRLTLRDVVDSRTTARRRMTGGDFLQLVGLFSTSGFGQNSIGQPGTSGDDGSSATLLPSDLGRTHGTTSEMRRVARYDAEQLVLWIVSRLAAGLAHAHERGIVHRDLKPANVLLSDDGEPMILDFNLSADSTAGSRQALVVGGTLPYMAPEHLQAVLLSGKIDERCDLFSLGVLMFQLLADKLPFSNRQGSLAEIVGPMVQERKQDIRRTLATLHDRASGSTLAILRRCLHPDPEQRYSSATQLHEDLELHLHDFPLRHAPEAGLSMRVRKWARRHPRLVSAGNVALAAVLLLAAVGGLAHSRGRHLARLQAVERLRQIETRAQAARAPLSVPTIDAQRLAEASRLARETIELTQFDQPAWSQAIPAQANRSQSDPSQANRRQSDPSQANRSEANPAQAKWSQAKWYRSLDASEQQAARECVGELLYLYAETLREKGVGNVDAGDEQRLLQALHYHELAAQVLPGANNRKIVAWQRAGLEQELRRLRQPSPGPSGFGAAAGPPATVIEKSSTAYAADEPDQDSRASLDLRLALGDSSDSLERSLIATQLVREGQYEAALPILEQLRDELPRDFHRWYLLGTAYAGVARMSDAEACYTACVALEPDSDLPYYSRGHARLENRRFAEAIEDFSHAWQLRPDNVACLINRALAKKALEDLPGAMEDLEQALQLPGRRLRVYLLRAEIWKQMGELTKAEQSQQLGWRYDPEDLSDWIALGLSRLPGDPQGALADFREAERIYGPSRRLLQNVAHVQAESLRQHTAAIATLERILTLEPQNAMALAGRGVLHARLGNRQAALQDCEQALQGAPSALTLYQVACARALLADHHDSSLGAGEREEREERDTSPAGGHQDGPADGQQDGHEETQLQEHRGWAKAAGSTDSAASQDVAEVAGTGTPEPERQLAETTLAQDMRESLRLLSEAVRREPPWIRLAVRDPDLLAIRGMPEFRRLVAAAQVIESAGRVGPDSRNPTHRESP